MPRAGDGERLALTGPAYDARQPNQMVRSLPPMVELLRRYSNRSSLLGPMLDVLRRIEGGDQSEELRSGVMARRGDDGLRRPSDRLSEMDVREIVSRFSAGVAKHRLAVDYGMSLSTMKRLLRRHRAQSGSHFVANDLGWHYFRLAPCGHTRRTFLLCCSAYSTTSAVPPKPPAGFPSQTAIRMSVVSTMRLPAAQYACSLGSGYGS